jgi:hypothetical protein
MKPVNIHSLPDTRCLEALRDACQRVLGPELQTPLAKHYLKSARPGVEPVACRELTPAGHRVAARE